jgi:hypothetical protein
MNRLNKYHCFKPKAFLFSICIFVSFEVFAIEKYKIEDFSINLSSILSPANHLWVMSGWSTVSPIPSTVMGVGDCFGAPFAGKGFKMLIGIEANNHPILDVGSFGKGDVGLLYSGGQWQPDKIIRNGTYHHLIDSQIVSFSVKTELIPLYKKSGFLLKCTIVNRARASLKIKLTPEITPGNPNFIPLNSWFFGLPKAGNVAIPDGSNCWSNENVRISLVSESTASEISTSEKLISCFAVTFSDKKTEIPRPSTLRNWENEERQAWDARLKWALSNVPVVKSTIPGLEDYYKRSITSGLVSIWENPAFVVNPFLTTCGMDGGGMCSYLWDFGGYTPGMECLISGSSIVRNARALAGIDLNRYYALTLDGTGIGVPYAYSTWSFVNLVWQIWKHVGINEKLFEEAKRLVMNNEMLASPNQMIDFGEQHNLLEMRGLGWEHFVVSPNAERVWCLQKLAEMGEAMNLDVAQIKMWLDQSLVIKKAIQDQLWDSTHHWFKCIHPNGHAELVYSIQVYDAIRAGVCSEEMTEDLIGHLKEGLFLFPYGVSSVSQEDSVHYEVNDPDWSGGGSYTGEGPLLAMLMYDLRKPGLAMDILSRHFWMGKHLPYYPQEHYVDRPAVPAHKRANISAGLAGAEAILFGMIGFNPGIDGTLWINPQIPANETVSVTGYGWRGHSVDFSFDRNLCEVLLDGKLVYHGIQKLIRVK